LHDYILLISLATGRVCSIPCHQALWQFSLLIAECEWYVWFANNKLLTYLLTSQA